MRLWDLRPNPSTATLHGHADAEGAGWREVARLVLHIDPELESVRARTAFDSHLTRAKWMTEQGYRHLLRGGASNSE
jgi:hypothetical protein